MKQAYAIKCSAIQTGILQNALNGDVALQPSEPEALKAADPLPDVVFVGWNGNSHLDSIGITAEKLMARLLTQVRSALSFKDVPVLLVAKAQEAQQARAGLKHGASMLLDTSQDLALIRSVVLDALKPPPNDGKIDVRYVNPFVEATVDVMRTMAQTEVRRKDLTLKRDHRTFGDYSAVIGISGEAVEGSVAITLDSALASEVVAKMLGLDADNLSKEDAQDGLGELVNMITGHAKTSLSESGLAFDLALPTVVVGVGHEIGHRPGTPCLSILFEAGEKPFAVQVALSEKR